MPDSPVDTYVEAAENVRLGSTPETFVTIDASSGISFDDLIGSEFRRTGPSIDEEGFSSFTFPDFSGDAATMFDTSGDLPTEAVEPPVPVVEVVEVDPYEPPDVRESIDRFLKSSPSRKYKYFREIVTNRHWPLESRLDFYREYAKTFMYIRNCIFQLGCECEFMRVFSLHLDLGVEYGDNVFFEDVLDAAAAIFGEQRCEELLHYLIQYDYHGFEFRW